MDEDCADCETKDRRIEELEEQNDALEDRILEMKTEFEDIENKAYSGKKL